MTLTAPPPKDFFVSYNRHDKQWAEWIAWTLEEAGYTVVIQAWDFRPGGNFVLDMQRAAAECEKTIAVLSAHYLTSEYTQSEWGAAFAGDPQSLKRKLIPMRVSECRPEGVLKTIVYVDLVGVTAAEAKDLVLGALRERAKPAQEPSFPGAVTPKSERTEPDPVAFPVVQPQPEVETKPSQTTPVEPSRLTTTSPVLEQEAVKLPMAQPTPASERAASSESSQPTTSPRTPSSESSQAVPTTPVLQPFEFDVLTFNAEGQEINRKRGQAQSFTEDLWNGVGLEMVAIPGGSFLMGSPDGGGNGSEKPQHSVTVQPFFMGKYAVTRAQWKVVSGLLKLTDPVEFKDSKRPVEKVSWDEAVEFCDRLSRKTGRQYRLPSEAEWEYACRAGTTTSFHFGDTLTPKLARCKANVGGLLLSLVGLGETANVGSFPPNAFGLYDLHGNVWEWCLDYWHYNYQGAPTDGSAWVVGGDPDRRVLRGGSWILNPRNCRSAYRINFTRVGRYNDIGFRVCCVPPSSLLSA